MGTSAFDNRNFHTDFTDCPDFVFSNPQNLYYYQQKSTKAAKMLLHGRHGRDGLRSRVESRLWLRLRCYRESVLVLLSQPIRITHVAA